MIAQRRGPVGSLAFLAAHRRIGIENAKAELGGIARRLALLQRRQDRGAAARIELLLGRKRLLRGEQLILIERDRRQRAIVDLRQVSELPGLAAGIEHQLLAGGRRGAGLGIKLGAHRLRHRAKILGRNAGAVRILRQIGRDRIVADAGRRLAGILLRGLQPLHHRFALGGPGDGRLLLGTGSIEIIERDLVQRTEIAGELLGLRRRRQRGVEAGLQLIGGERLFVGREFGAAVAGDRKQRAAIERGQIDGRLAGAVIRAGDFGIAIKLVERAARLADHRREIFSGTGRELRARRLRQRQMRGGAGAAVAVLLPRQQRRQRWLRCHRARIGRAGVRIAVIGGDRRHRRAPGEWTVVKNPLVASRISARG